ncbi:MAG TPA: hypothetical protein VJL61_03265 [Rhodanobacteraceae bacterium]|nr:hypothetical protein [Rhodanobacteraceae bacterium]
MGDTCSACAAAYFKLLRETLADDDLVAIRTTYLQQQRALSRRAFQTMVQIKTRRYAGVRPVRRPDRAAPDKK